MHHKDLDLHYGRFHIPLRAVENIAY